MSDERVGGQEPRPAATPSDAQLAEMSRDELVRLGSALDGVEIVHREDPFPVEGTRAEKRAERNVAGWFALAALTGLGFVAAYVFWPFEYVSPSDRDGHVIHKLYTPIIGTLLGISIFAIGAGAIAYAKHLLPHETAVQDRHDGGSSEVDRRTTAAILADSGVRSRVTRRPLIVSAAALGAGALGLAIGVFTLGGLIRNPWKGEDQAALWVTGWASPDGERTYLRRDTGEPEEVVLVRPEDLDAGGIEKVFPFRESMRGDEEELHRSLRGSDVPTMLFRLRPEQAAAVTKRKGQEDFNYGDYYAYSIVCTHLGCPASLWEAQTGRLLCPCHQSQFDIMTYAKPVFGPASRALPQLALDVDEEGYFYARHDYVEPVGPAFWELKA